MPAWDDTSVALEKRAPRLVVRLERLFIDTVNSYLFGEMRSPAFAVEGGTEPEQQDASDRVAGIYTSSGLKALLPELGRLGLTCSSVAVGFHYARDEGQDEGVYYTELIQTGMCKPTFGRDDRARARAAGVGYDDLLELDEYWMSLDEDPDTGKVTMMRHRRLWTTTATVEFKPVSDDDATAQIGKSRKIAWSEDKENTVTHDFGFVPVEWFANGGFVAGDIDGFMLVDEAEWDIFDAANYTFSQTHRGIQYNQDPWLVFKNAKIDADSLKKGGGRTLSVNTDPNATHSADAALLEMTGAGQTLGLTFVNTAKMTAAQICQVVLHDPGAWSGALSGTALERLLAPMLVMVAELRGSYGAGLSRLMRKMLAAPTALGGATPAGLRVLGDLTVTTNWGPLIDPTESDAALALANAITAYDAGFITFEMAVAKVIPYFGRDDAAQVIEALQSAGTTTPGTTPATTPPGAT